MLPVVDTAPAEIASKHTSAKAIDKISNVLFFISISSFNFILAILK
jgi:hypothetical protein